MNDQLKLKKQTAISRDEPSKALQMCGQLTTVLRFSRCLIVAILLFPFLAYGQTEEMDLQQVLQKLDKGESVEHARINLGDINFATGTANLEPSAKLYLDKIVKLLLSAPNMDMKINGHTDNTGSDAVNVKLAIDRATVVKYYLSSKGVPVSRLTAAGFGSTAPVADNNTEAGRAKNRRVEMEIIRQESVRTVQDVIVLRNGERIGSTVAGYNSKVITYRQFSNTAEQQISISKVDRIIYADGRVVTFDQSEPAIAPSPKPAKSTFNPFARAAAFHQGQFVIGLGAGLENNIGIGYKAYSVTVPPVWLTAETPIGTNFGAGISAGAMLWSLKNDDNGSYMYYTLSPRVAYHFNLGPKVDFYSGVAFTGRLGLLSFDLNNVPTTLSKFKADVSLFSGIRYYFSQGFGVNAEYGGDNAACFRGGIALRFGR